MGGLIPLTDASRRPVRFPIVTVCIILANFFAFVLELRGGDAFAGGRTLIPKSPLGGPSLRVCFMQGWGLSAVLFPISIFHFPAVQSGACVP